MIALASDHAGFLYKERAKEFLSTLNVEFKDFGTFSTDSTDYPEWGHVASEAISSGNCDKGIFICGTGIGISIVANKHNGVRAAACESVTAAILSRKHNNANVLCFGERLVGWGVVEDMIQAFITTKFEGGRHTQRVEKIHSLTGR